MKYYYLVSFVCENKFGMAYGDAHIIRDYKIKTNEHIAELRKTIMNENNISKINILNIILLDCE